MGGFRIQATEGRTDGAIKPGIIERLRLGEQQSPGRVVEVAETTDVGKTKNMKGFKNVGKSRHCLLEARTVYNLRGDE